MPPTATASEPRRRWRAWAPRWLVILHRYLGVTLGLLMLLWCVSGVVMLFVRYPSVAPNARVAALPQIAWSRCCAFGEVIAGDARVSAATVEDLAGAPVLRVRAGDARHVVDLSSGRAIEDAPAATAALVASQFGRAPSAGVTAVERDQWTVTGYFNDARPFWRVRLADGQGTDVYVSRRTGQVVQHTTRAGRVLNWFGAIPHWLYPAILRQDVKLWTQVVVWTSLLGTFLTVTGLYLGLVAWRPSPDRLSPFRGLMTWHHLTGLAAGLLTLTWVASGLFSMNPWGFLESREDPAVERLHGDVRFADLRAAVGNLAARTPPTGQVRLAPLDGRVFLVSGDARYDADGAPAPLSQGDLRRLGARLGPVHDQRLITEGDAYYFPHHETVRLPAWRVVREDGLRVYLDPASGEVLSSVDAAGRGFRWLHLGLHRLDFLPGFDRGPGWAAAMVVLLAGVTFSVGVGVWLGWRRVGHDLSRLTRRAG